MAPVLEIENLSTHIKLTSSVVQAVGNVDMRIDAGETLGVVGESGCGKSMTGLSIMGLLPPGGSVVEGSIKLDGRELVGLKSEDMRRIRGNEIAMIFQDPMTSLNPVYKVGWQIEEQIREHEKVGRQAARARAIDLLASVGIPNAKDRVDSYPHEFSGGMRQRVMIAMAISCNPDVLIADEQNNARRRNVTRFSHDRTTAVVYPRITHRGSPKSMENGPPGYASTSSRALSRTNCNRYGNVIRWGST